MNYLPFFTSSFAARPASCLALPLGAIVFQLDRVSVARCVENLKWIVRCKERCPSKLSFGNGTATIRSC
jgi:hypothetical protein